MEDLTDIRPTAAWLRLIAFCKNEMPHGEISLRIVNGEPTTLLSQKPTVRFDRPSTIPATNIR